MGNRQPRQDRRILEASKRHQKRKKKETKELNVFMVGLDGAGKSTILYKHLARDTYPSGSINIPQTITYNVETVKHKHLSPHLQRLQRNSRSSPILSSSKYRGKQREQRSRTLAARPPVPPVKPINPIHPQFIPIKPIDIKSSQCKALQSLPSEQVSLNIYDYGGSRATRKLWTNYKEQRIPQLRRTRNKIDFIVLVVDCTDFERLSDENFDCVQFAMKDLLNNNKSTPLCILANKQDLPNAIPSLILPYRLGIKQITIWNLITNIQQCQYGINLSWKLSEKIISFLPHIEYHWNMTQRVWTIYGTSAIYEYNQGINNGIQWLFDQYDREHLLKKNNEKKRRNSSFTQRFRMTM